MKKKILAMVMIMLCLASATTVFARGYDRGGYGGYHGHRGGHHDNGLGIAFGVVGGLLLGSALLYSAPPPRPVAYGYPLYQPESVVRPRVCVEDSVVNGEWQVSRYDGRQIWVSYPYPVTQRVQIPCY